MASPLTGAFAQPEKQQSTMQKIGEKLQGFGAGYRGQGQQFLANKELMSQSLSEERTGAMIADAMQVYTLLDADRFDDAISLIDDRVENISKLGGDPSDTLNLRQRIISGDLEGARMDLKTLLSDPRAQQFMPQRPEPVSVANNAALVDPTTGQEIYSNREPQAKGFRLMSPQEAAQSGLPSDKQFQINEDSGQISQLGGSGTSVTTNVNSSPENSYAKGRAEQQATAMGELEKAAEGAYRANRALDRFVAASSSGDAGAAQPFITGVKSLISSFGFDVAGLTDTVVMQQAIGDILGAKMAELGARGLTDKDMQILRDALPRVETSHPARMEVADIIRKGNMATIGEYSNQVNYEQQNYPDYNFMRPSWLSDAQGMLESAPTQTQIIEVDW